MKRCAIYARYSSDLQSPTSIEDQHQLCRAYAERRSWAVVSLFEDAALSGFGIEHRPGYQQLLAAALSSPAAFEVVLVEDLSRLTRDMAELLRVTTRLRLKGVELVGVSDGIATSQQGAKMHVAVKGLVNELYLDDLRDKTHRGLSGSVARGMSAGGRLYGYRTVQLTREAKPGDRSTPARAEVKAGEAEIAKHLDGELTVRPLPSTGQERRAEIRGRAKLNSLLEGQEAVCGGVVAGAGFAECYTTPATYWVDLIRP